MVTYKAKTAKNSFLAIELVLFNLDRVIQQLDVYLNRLTPPPSRSSDI